MITIRKSQYYDLNTKLTYCSNDDIKNMLNEQKTKTIGYGTNKIITVDGVKIFTKTIPLTEFFYKNYMDTSNLYDLPMHYNYGIGSAGNNPWREVSMHVKTTNWVLNDKIPNFPLLYHFRVIKNKSKKCSKTNPEYKWTMNRWNNDKKIEKYFIDRCETPYTIVLFLEYIPDVLIEYWNTIDYYEEYMTQFPKIVDYLSQNNILHMDSHAGNYLVGTDGMLYLTDFGLTIDKEFNLSKNEIKFVDANNTYDFVLSIYSVFNAVMSKILITQNYKKLCTMGFELSDKPDTEDGYDYNIKYLLENKIIFNNIVNILNVDNVLIKMINDDHDIILEYHNFRQKSVQLVDKSLIDYPNKKLIKMIN